MSNQHKITSTVNLKLEAEEFKQLYMLFFGMTKEGTCHVTELNNIFATLDKKAKIVYGPEYEKQKAELLEIVNKSK